MCSMYWTLTGVNFTCPQCGKENSDSELQTHFMGDVGSCINYYKMGEPVAELGNISVTLRPPNKEDFIDDFIGDCEFCEEWLDFGARIENGVVIAVWPIKQSS